MASATLDSRFCPVVRDGRRRADGFESLLLTACAFDLEDMPFLVGSNHFKRLLNTAMELYPTLPMLVYRHLVYMPPAIQ